MNELEKLLEKFNAENPPPCWYYDEEMRKECYIKKPCEPRPGTTCPACGITWE